MSTISGNHYSGVVLTSATYTNPVTIASGVYILNAGGDGVLGQTIAWTVVNNGFVHADGTGHAGIDLAAGGVFKNDVGAEILGDAGANGVDIAGAGAVTNYGEIIGNTAVALASGDSVKNGFRNIFGRTLGTITGSAYGISGSTGSVTNVGTISDGTGVGIRFTGTGTVTNIYGTIAGEDAVSLGGANGVVTNFATISGGFDGVLLTAGGSVANTGLITSGFYGVKISGSAGSLSNFGTVQGSVGVKLTAGGTVQNGDSNTTGAVISGTLGDGVQVTFGTASVENFGTISASGDGVYLEEGGIVTNYGDIIGKSLRGVIGFGATTVANYGTITGYIGVLGNGPVVNGGSGATTASISGSHYGIDLFDKTSTVINLGTVSGSTAGIKILGGSVTNGQSGSTAATVLSDFCGVSISGTGTVTNFGSVLGQPLGGVKVFGVSVQRGTVINAGTISGQSTSSIFGFGVTIAGNGTVINGANGAGGALITGNGYGVVISGGAGATVVNTATITGGQTGLQAAYGGPITNGASGSATALISGGRYGVEVLYSPAAITNFATISSTQVGIRAEYGGTILNGASGASAALITGGHIGIQVDYGVANLTNSATIGGTGGIGVGVWLKSGGTLTNAGTISGGGGTAVLFGGTGGNLLVLDAGYNFDGVVQGSASATNRVELAGTPAGTFSGLGGSVLGFGTVAIDGTASWKIVVAAAAFAGETITGNNKTMPLVVSTGGTADLSGVSGFPVIDLASSAADSITLTDANFAGVTSGVITVIGGNAGNTVNASAVTGANRVIVVGGGGIDTLTGGAGNDVFKFSVANLAATDTVVGGLGADQLQMTTSGTVAAGRVSRVETYVLASSGANKLSLSNANFTGVTGATITVDGGSAGNTVNASAVTGANRVIVVGGAGIDTLTGGAGNDVFKFSVANLAATDTVVGGLGADELLMTTSGTVAAGRVSGVETYALAAASANSLTLTNANFTNVTNASIHVVGGAAGNTVNAAALTGSNRLVFTGGAGSDIIKAGLVTTLTGGAGANQFVFAAVGTHAITDFAAGAGNAIVLSNAGFDLGIDNGTGTATPQRLDASLFVANATGAFTSTSQRFAYNTTSGNLRYDPDGSGPMAAAGFVAALTDHASLSAGALGNLAFVA